MGYEKVIRGHYEDLNNLTGLLKNYIDIYRVLVSSAGELNSISTAKKSEMKHIMERINEVGELIDSLLKVIDKCESSYIKYCFLKNEVVSQNTMKDTIKTEINDELDSYNKDDEDDEEEK
ncbi:hypothetical protein [uncultured Clostridium sp.]|uniref:hypothetical protein n=1 Tax=uncultured Clostridium sp. TaxID=59620 RepID=UPI002600DB5A|nr:hypothetical protein [uncultured Clostridium sp.]